MTVAEGNVSCAFGLVCVAGASTTIGASVVFSPSLVKRASRRLLASSLGLSSGAMVYVSFVEILPKGAGGFEEAGIEENRANIYAALGFFGGVLVMVIIDLCIKRITRDHAPIHREQDDDIDIEVAWNTNEENCETPAEQREPYVPRCYCLGCTGDPAGELQVWHELAEQELEGDETAPTDDISTSGRRDSSSWNDEESENNPSNIQNELKEGKSGRPSDEGAKSGDCSSQETKAPDEGPKTIRVIVDTVPTPQEREGDGGFRGPACDKIHPKEEHRKLLKASYGTALAIFLHNFPEGIATFVAALDDPKVGAVLATAIGIHNIPEGLCVALPVYYATGSRWKAFRWGIFAGISEPIAALLGWAVLASVITPEAFGVVFGLASGMMAIISLKELVPTAYRYDPDDTVVSSSIMVGMGIMALSLVLFKV